MVNFRFNINLNMKHSSTFSADFQILTTGWSGGIEATGWSVGIETQVLKSGKETSRLSDEAESSKLSSETAISGSLMLTSRCKTVKHIFQSGH